MQTTFLQIKSPRWIKISIATFMLIILLLSLSYFTSMNSFRIAATLAATQAGILIREPMPTTRYILVEPNELCFDVPLTPPLVRNVDDRDNDAFLASHTELFVDGGKIFDAPASQLDLLMLAVVADEQGTPVPWGGPLQTCYNIHFASGLHLATVRITGMSGKVYTYSWAFETR